MALQVWLPMVSNFNNQGLYNSVITNNNVTLDNNGKLGKCGNFTGSNYLSGTINLGDSIEYTLACWVKPPAVSSGNKQIVAIASNAGWVNCRATMFYRQNTAEFVATLSNGTDSLGYTMAMTAIPNVWQHIAVTFKNKTITWYSNGVVQKTLTTAFNPKFSDIAAFGVGAASNGAEKFTGYINDVRIYDSCLSPKEVEVLSRGLVCHYPLNNNGGGQPNLYDFESVASKWVIEGLTLANATDEVYGNVLKITSPSSVSSQRIYRAVSNVWKADTKFTVSFLAKASKTAVVKMSRSLANYAPDVTVGTTWKRYSTVITCSTTAEGGTLSIQTSTASADIYLTQIKLELGDKATVYCPGVGDSHYIPLGYGDTTEYDVSGYGNNGTKQYITYETDTPRYSASSVLSGSSTRIPNTTINIGNEWSYGLWFKSAATTRTWEGLVILNNNGGDPDMQLGFYTNPNSSLIQTTANGQYTSISHTYDDKWHHLFATFDGTTLKTYKDGELVNTKSITNSLLSRSNLTLGARYRGGTTFDLPYKGSVSDFRLYATALSATQVAELYNTAVSVANNGTLMGYELVEG